MVRAYYTPTSLQAMKQSVQETLSTESIGNGLYLFNISAINSSTVEVDTPIVHHSVVTRTVYNRQPIAIYTVSKVLLPKEIFGRQTYSHEVPLSDLQPHLPPTSGVSSASEYFGFKLFFILLPVICIGFLSCAILHMLKSLKK
jgi:hypothetical protein